MGGVSTISVENFLSHSAENCRRGTLQSFINFWYRNSLDEKVGGGVYQDFPSKIFCPKVPKKVVGQPFRVSLISGIEKFHTSEGYVTIFCRYFLSHSTEKFRWENPSLLCFRKFPVAIKLMDKKKGRVSRISVESFLSDLAKNS